MVRYDPEAGADRRVDAVEVIGDAATDGRKARRERGRQAVVEATIDLVLEGLVPPGADDIARRAGVSTASLFRYFDTLDDLRRATVQRYQARVAHLVEIPDIGQGSLDSRVGRFVATRLALYAATEPMARLARSRVGTLPDIDDGVHRARVAAAEQIRGHFARELAGLTAARRDDVVATIATTTSFECWLQLRDDYSRTTAQTRRAWSTTLHHLIPPN